jgi:hypothetical protein
LTNSPDASVLWEGPEGLLKFDMFIEEIDAGTFDPAPVPKPWAKVNHRTNPEWGTGKIMAVKDSEKGNALVYFAGREYKHQLTECEFSELEVITDDQR